MALPNLFVDDDWEGNHSQKSGSMCCPLQVEKLELEYHFSQQAQERTTKMKYMKS